MRLASVSAATRSITIFALCIHAAPTVAASEALLYRMDPEGCARSVIPSARGGARSTAVLWVNRNATACAPTLGVTAAVAATPPGAGFAGIGPPGVQSSWTTGELLRPLAAEHQVISVELWFKPGDSVDYSDGELRPILSVGRTTVDVAALDLSVCSKYGVDWLVGMRAGHVEVYYRVVSPVLEPCRKLRSEAPLPPDALAHLVVSLENERQHVFLNGQGPLVGGDLFSGELTHWDPKYRLQLLNNPSFRSTPWQGTIYQLSIASSSPDLSTVRAQIRAGLPPTRSYALNYSLTVHEDGEATPRSHTPGWYRQSPGIHEAEPVDLRVGSVERELQQLLKSTNLTSPTARASAAYVYVTRLPDRGCLYRMDGFKLGCGNETRASDSAVLLAVPGDSPRVVYIPPLNKYSIPAGPAFATMRYCVADAPVLHPSQCQSGTVQLVVAPVNDPPIARPVETIRVLEGLETIQTPSIVLSGTDVDMGDAITQVQITKPPAKGELILSVGSFRQDGLPHGVKLSDLNFIVHGPETVAVKYLYRSRDTNEVVQDDDVSDSFHFRVADRSGAWSDEERVNIVVRPAVKAFPDAKITTTEDFKMMLDLKWFAVDTSGYRRKLRLVAVSVPAVDIGTLFDDKTGQPISQGSMIGKLMEYPYSGAIPLYFLAAPDYCNSDGQRPSPYIGLRAVAYDEANRIISLSDEQRQPIFVQCMIDPLILKVPTGNLLTVAQSIPFAVDDPCYGHVFDPRTTDDWLCKSHALVIDGIEVESKDSDETSVQVSVSSDVGYITFNPNFWNKTLPIHGRRSITQNSTFLTTPTALPDVLSSLHYQAFTAGLDEIAITLQYGPCTSIDANISGPWPPFPAPDCQILRQTIPVYVVESDEQRLPANRMGPIFPWQILFCWFGYPAMYYVYMTLHKALYVSDGNDDDVTMDVEKDLPIDQVDDDEDNYGKKRDYAAITWLSPIKRNASHGM